MTKWLCSLAMCCAVASVSAQTPQTQTRQTLTTVRLNIFPNATNLALYLGIANGVFEKRGITVDLRFTQNYEALRDGLAKGEFEIAYSAVDNAVAMVETANADVVIVSGDDTSMNEFMTRAEIQSLADLRGKAPAPDRYIDLGYYTVAHSR